MAQRQAQKQQHMSEQLAFRAHMNSVLQAVKAEQVFSCMPASFRMPTMPDHLLGECHCILHRCVLRKAFHVCCTVWLN